MPERPPGVGGRAARGCDSAPDWRGEGRALDGTETGLSYGRAPGLQEMPRMSARGAGRIETRDRLARREAQRRLRRARRKAKGLVPPFPTQRPRLGKASGDDNSMTNRSFKIEARQILLVLRNSAFLHEVILESIHSFKNTG